MWSWSPAPARLWPTPLPLPAQGIPKNCGYACGTVDQYSPDGEEILSWDDDGWCSDGCAIPMFETGDPFIEHTYEGFRGFWNRSDIEAAPAATAPRAAVDATYDLTDFDGDKAVCARTCDEIAKWGLAPSAAALNLFTEIDLAGFNTYCGTAQDANGFATNSLAEATRLVVAEGRGQRGIISREDGTDVDTGRKSAVPGSAYWWNGLLQKFPNVKYQENALIYAQTAYFVSIIVVQWADLLISKTRRLSAFEQGMRNGFMNFGLVFETVLGVILVYVPPFWNLGIRPIYFLHWFTGAPWSMLIFLYDESRKFMLRNGWFNSWLELTYW